MSSDGEEHQEFYHLFMLQVFTEHLSRVRHCCSRYCGYSSEQEIKSLASWDLYLSHALGGLGGVLCMEKGTTSLQGEVALMGRVGSLTLWRVLGTRCPGGDAGGDVRSAIGCRIHTCRWVLKT